FGHEDSHDDEWSIQAGRSPRRRREYSGVARFSGREARVLMTEEVGGPARREPARERQAPFDRRAVPFVAEALAVEPERLPLSIPGREVYQLILADRRGRSQTLVTLWPWLGRVDVVTGAATMTVTGVIAVRAEIGGVAFCRRSGETVALGRDGRVVARL
ncbi:MAG TPA: hypothetical protein VFX03_01115, partial [Thermomicrobiales bacterium]|nr:hypothetical protein [Thermomicrobiales bacterium]